MLTNTWKTPFPFKELGYWMDLRNKATAPSDWMASNLGDPSKASVEFAEGNPNKNFNTTCTVTALNRNPEIGPVGSQSFAINRLDLSAIDRVKPRFSWPDDNGIVRDRKTAFNILMEVYDLPLYGTVNDQIPWLLNPDDDVSDQAFIELEVDSKLCPYYFGKLRVCTLDPENIGYILQNNVINNTEPLNYYDILWKVAALNPITVLNENPYPEEFVWEIEAYDGPEGTNTRATIRPDEGALGSWIGESYIYYNRFDFAEYTASLPHTLALSGSANQTNYVRSSLWLSGNQFQYRWKPWDVVDPDYQNPPTSGSWSFTTGSQCRTWFPGTVTTLTLTSN